MSGTTQPPIWRSCGIARTPRSACGRKVCSTGRWSSPSTVNRRKQPYWSRRCRRSSARGDFAADDLLHDLGRATVDRLYASVDECAGDRILGHVAVAAVQLQAAVDDALLQLADEPLALGGVDIGEFA